MSNPFDLTGRTALITGSSRGLGLAIAQGMAKAGASVILNGVNAERLDTSAQEMRAAGHQVETLCFDVTDEDAVIAAFDNLDGKGIAVDILVNNAGIQYRKPMLELETENWHRVLDTNLTSAFFVGRQAARRMVARGHGKIINIGSLMSDLGRATVAPYTVAKGGIKMLTKAMAAEWAEHADRHERSADQQSAIRRLGQSPHARAPLGQTRRTSRHRRLPRLLRRRLHQRPDHLRRRRHERRGVIFPSHAQRRDLFRQPPQLCGLRMRIGGFGHAVPDGAQIKASRQA